MEKLEKENKKLKEEVETLELWLDNKEKLNEEYRKQIDKLKSDLEWYKEHYGPKPLTTIEEVQNFKGNTIWM